MNRNFSKNLASFSGPDQARLLLDGNWGLEKESQRITNSGDLALTGHPAVFGNKLTNPHITTDFAESQIELITPPFRNIEDTYRALETLQAEVEAGIGPELLWPLSMPPRLPAEEDIPIAVFPDTLEGREKAVYRRGLALRYGKKMQMISGIHYNFSFGPEMMDYLFRVFGKGRSKRDFADELYFAVARNFFRYRWLLIYLFGASPSVDVSYDSVIANQLRAVAACCPGQFAESFHTMMDYPRYTTSLRVSSFGYAGPVPENGGISSYLKSLADYIKVLRGLLGTKSQTHSKLGIYQKGVQMQLNDNVLQKESEFYSPIRPKQILNSGETQLEAIEQRGVKYLEVRILDLNPFESLGINMEELYFLQVFMLFCLFETGGPLSKAEYDRANRNHQLVSLLGRRPGLKLFDFRQGPILLQDWGRQLFFKLGQIADLLDKAVGAGQYQASVNAEFQKINDISLLPSARIQREMEQGHLSFLEFGLHRAAVHRGESHRVMTQTV